MNLVRKTLAAGKITGGHLRVVFMLLLVTLVSGALYAQSGDEYSSPPAQAEPAPAQVTTKQLENGRILVSVGTTRYYGYRIGDRIPLTVVISTEPGVDVNTEALSKGILSAEGSDFRLVNPAVITQTQENGRNLTVIQLTLVSYVTKQSLVFNAGFYYALEKLPNGAPAWKPATTSDFTVTTSNTATESAKDLVFASRDSARNLAPPLTKTLMVAGGALLSLLPIWGLWLLYRRLFPPKVVPAHELAWKTIDGVLAQHTDGSGLSYEQTQVVTSALRRYLQVESVPLKDVRGELEKFYKHHSKRYELARIAHEALETLERALFHKPSDGDLSKQALSDADLLALLRKAEQFVPRT